MKRTRVLFRGTNVLHCGFSLRVFSPVGVTNSKKNSPISPVILSWIITLEGNTRPSTVDFLRLNTLSGIQTTFLIQAVPPPPGGGLEVLFDLLFLFTGWCLRSSIWSDWFTDNKNDAVATWS